MVQVRQLLWGVVLLEAGASRHGGVREEGVGWLRGIVGRLVVGVCLGVELGRGHGLGG